MGKQPHILLRKLAILICVVQPSQLPILFPLSQIARHFYKSVSAFITLLLSLFTYVVDKPLKAAVGKTGSKGKAGENIKYSAHKRLS